MIKVLGTIVLAIFCLASTPAVSQEMFEITLIQRQPGLTVVGIKPTNPGDALAVDLHPKGSVTNSGKAWIDVCDRDYDPNPGMMRCTRMVMTATAAQFGVSANNLSRVPVEIVSGSTKLGVFKLRDGDTGPQQLIVGEFNSLDMVTSMAKLRGQVSAMRAEMAQMRAEMRRTK